jgi:ABC-2 type transport system ATP-binding protein
MDVVVSENLTKSYGKVNAIKGLSFSVGKGEIFGFIGPDGAGKTTCFRILTTLLKPDTGTATLLGLDSIKDYRKLRNLLGYMPGRFSLYQDLTIEENLNFFASIFGTTIKENYYLIKDIYEQIEPFKKRKAGKLSGGMKQKLALSCALIHKPEILVLDEPTTGVDAVSRKEFWEMLRNLKEQGITIIVSTPYMDEASLCDRVALIQEGMIMSIDTPSNIVNSFGSNLYAIKGGNVYQLLKALESYEHCASVYPFGEYLHYIDKRNNPDLNELNNYLISNRLEKTVIKEIVPDIEDSFMQQMRKQGNGR